jgi:hypothetical protein
LWSSHLHCALFAVQGATADVVTPVPRGKILKVTFNQESFECKNNRCLKTQG